MNKLFVLAIMICGFIGCTTEPEVKIEFCDTPDFQGSCEDGQDEFLLGKIYVILEASTSFKTKKITGTVYSLLNGQKIFLGSKDFIPEPDGQHIAHSIPFDEFGERGIGEFMVEFVDENNALLAEKAIQIKK